MIHKITNFKVTSDLKKIFQLSWPVMVGMILQSLLGTVDMMFISMLGTEPLASASIANSVTSVVFVFSTLVSAGVIALVSRSYGEEDMDAVRKFSGEAFLISMIIGGILSILCFAYTVPIIKLMFNPEAAITNFAKEYLAVMFIGTIFVFLNSAARTIMQALGDTRTPLYIFGASNIINAVFTPLFMFPLNMGIAGAAWASVLSMVFSLTIITFILIKRIYGNSFISFIKSMKLEIDNTIRILKIGSWACIQQIARPITGMLMVRLVYEVGGNPGSAAFGAGGQLINYTFIFLVGLSTAIAIMVGQSLGRKDIHGCDSIIKEGIKLAVFNMVLFAIPYFIFPEAIMKIFSREYEVVKVGAEYLRIVYLGLIFVIFPIIYGGVFQGAGDTFPPMISSLVANVVLKLPIAYVLAKTFNMGTNGVWIAVALSVVIEAAIIIIYFKRNKWKEKVI
jgi:putative MATE family efflux protein